MTPSWLKADVSPALVDKITIVVCEFLENNDLRTIPENKKHHIRKTYLKTAYLRGVVQDCFDSAYLNPSGGKEIEAGIKLLSAAYGESGFYWKARHVNRNGTTDAGILQVNSVHWFGNGQIHPTWSEFCNTMGLDYGLNQLWTPRINIEFAATINEIIQKTGKHGYKYASWKRPDQIRLYRLLQGVIKAEVP